MDRGFSRSFAGLILLLMVCVLSMSAGACTVPVHRWALEQWAPDFYDLYVFHEGALAEAQSVPLDAFVREEPPLNLHVHAVDLSGQPGEFEAALWGAQKNASTPWMVLRYPRSPPQRPGLWSATLTGDNLGLIRDSAARRGIVQRLSEGNTAVWVFLESGDEEKDGPAFALIEEELGRIRETLTTEAEMPAAGEDPATRAPEPIRFALSRLRRDDSAERVFTEMLLGSEADLYDYDEPMVFPVFGRGRALYAILGKGITRENLREACAFLYGPCSCIVKDQNPGTDLLLTANWEDILAGNVATTPLPPAEKSPPPPELEIEPAGLGALAMAGLVLGLSAAAAVLLTALMVLRQRANTDA